jgi:hypothetical protein
MYYNLKNDSCKQYSEFNKRIIKHGNKILKISKEITNIYYYQFITNFHQKHYVEQLEMLK